MYQLFQKQEKKKKILKICSDCRDTVSSLGAIRGRSLPVATASTNARTFRHALSLDERRARFQVHSWKEKRIDRLNHHDTTNHRTETDVEEVWFAVRVYWFRDSYRRIDLLNIIRDVIAVRLYSLFLLSFQSLILFFLST